VYPKGRVTLDNIIFEIRKLKYNYKINLEQEYVHL